MLRDPYHLIVQPPHRDILPHLDRRCSTRLVTFSVFNEPCAKPDSRGKNKSSNVDRNDSEDLWRACRLRQEQNVLLGSTEICMSPAVLSHAGTFQYHVVDCEMSLLLHVIYVILLVLPDSWSTQGESLLVGICDSLRYQLTIMHPCQARR